MATHSVQSPVVNPTRRNTYRRLAQMHGDQLTRLRNPPRAEAARPLIGQLEAHRAAMDKQVSLWYKEQNFTINKINRSQAKFYKAFVSKHFEQKRLHRLALEKRSRPLDPRAAIGHVLSPEPKGKRVFPGSMNTGSESSSSQCVDGETAQRAEGQCEGEYMHEKVEEQFVDGDMGKKLKGKCIDGDAGADLNAQVVIRKKYNRHRSEFPVIVNAPTTIDCPKSEPDVVALVVDPKGNGSLVVGEQELSSSGIKISDRHAKVLVVRQTAEGGNLPEKSEALERGGSFIMERSGSICIQTVIMANEGIVEKAAVGGKEPSETFTSRPNNRTVTSPIVSLPPKKPCVHGNISTSIVLPPISEAGSKSNCWHTDTSGTAVSSPPKSKVPKQSRRKGASYKLGKLNVHTRSQKQKPPPHTSCTISIREAEKQQECATMSWPPDEPSKGKLHSHSSEQTGTFSNSYDTGDGKATMTLAQYNRMWRIQQDQERREILDRETPIIYEKDATGKIVWCGYNFRRREFKRPSSHEKKVRRKLLYQSHENQKQERKKVMAYIDKLSEEERLEQQERDKRAKQRAIDAAAARAEEKKKRHAAEMGPGVLLRRLICAFQKGNAVSEHEDPNSVRSLQKCSYLRLYEYNPHLKNVNPFAAKKSSWKQKSLAGWDTSR